MRDLNAVPVRQERRVEVIANGLPLWGGVQLAVWCRPSLQLACCAETVAAPQGQLCVSLNVPKLGHTQHLFLGAAVGSSCLALRLEGAGVPKPLSLSDSLPEARPVPLLLHSGRRVLLRLCCAGLRS